MLNQSIPSERAALAPPSVEITVNTHLVLPAGLPSALERAICQLCTLDNPAWQAAVEYERSTAGLVPTLLYYHRGADGTLAVPRGAMPAVYQLCLDHGLQVTWRDETVVAPPVAFGEHVTPMESQETALAQLLKRRIGVLEAPAGSGKTIMGLVATARRGQPTLWLTHTTDLARQTIAAAVAVLGIPESEIGLLGDGQWRIGERFTVALTQSLASRGVPDELRTGVGHVVVDECHHVPCEQTAAILEMLPARYLLGLSATPYRRDGLDQVITFCLGPVTARIDKSDLQDRLIRPRVVRRDTGCRPDGETFVEIVSDLVENSRRTASIVADVQAAVAQGRHCVILSDRREHCEEIAEHLRAVGVRAVTLHGQMNRKARAAVVAGLAAETVQALVATGQLVGEGFNAPRLDTLFLATPARWEGRIIQMLGRVSRTAPGKRDALVYDYCDDNRMLWGQWAARRRTYKREGLTVTHGGDGEPPALVALAKTHRNYQAGRG